MKPLRNRRPNALPLAQRRRHAGYVVVAIFFCLAPAAHGQANAASDQLRLKRPLDAELIRQKTIPKATRDLLPPVRLKLLVDRPADLPQALRDAIERPTTTARPANQLAQFICPADRSTLNAALRSGSVRRIEIERPRQSHPVARLSLDPDSRTPFNLDARRSHFVPEFEGTFHMGRGATITAAIFDGGIVRRTHVEFATDRISIGAVDDESSHATHVAGTMAAKGVKALAIGMAPKLKLISYNWDDDIARLGALGSTIQVSNHSYGPIAGWHYDRDSLTWYWFGDTTVSPVEDVGFGRYGSDAVAMDDCLHRNPQVLAVAAAGNDRSDAPPVQPISHYVIGTHPTTEAPVWVIAGDYRNPDGFDHGGLDTITGLGLAKNTLCVGAINDLFSEGQPISGATIQSTYFSGWGPADDGRIKPDVVANGESLVSPTIPPPGASAPDGVYVELSGTSMASPTACGIAAVLAEFIRDRHGAPPAAAQVKAVMIHSATDAGPPGPDPIFGWGSVHAFRAGELIAGQSGAVLPMAGVREGDSKRHEFEASGGPVRVTLVWTDPPGQPNGGPLDDPTSALTNDLDLTLTTPEGKVLHPYRLVRAGPDWVSRTDEPNHVDNVEVIDAPDQAGAWAVTVRGTDLRVGDEQSFALCVTGLRPPA